MQARQQKAGPLAGVTVRSYSRAEGPGHFRVLYPAVRATTDAEGRYRLTGMARGEGYRVAVIPGRDHPYLFAAADVPDGPGLDPVTLDVGLRRGVWIEGKLTDKLTGKPVKGGVEYFSLYDNPNLRDYPGFEGALLGDLAVGTKEDGSYRVAGLPGPGLVAVYCRQEGYLRADQLRPILDGLGISIITTSKGVMSDRRARAQHLGGEVLCKVW